MHILYATQWFDPEPILKGIYFVKLMRAQGHEVSVVTGFPNYPGGRIYPGYRLKLFRRDYMDEIQVDRVPLYPSHSRSIFGRTLNYASYGIALTIYGLITPRRFDVMYVYHPPLTSGLATAIIAGLRRVPFVYAIHDLWPDTLAASGMVSSPLALRLVDRLCRWVYARADRIVVISPGFKRILCERGVPESKIEVVYNWAIEEQAQSRGDSDLAAFGLNGRFNVVYAGNLGAAQGLETVLGAAKIVEDVAPNVQFILIGAGIEADRLRSLAAELAARSIRIMPSMPPSEIGNLLAAADVLLVHLRDEPLFRITIPSKTQFYLAMGKPILMGVHGDSAEMIEKAGAGVIVGPEDARALADAVLALARLPSGELAAMGGRGRTFYDRELSAAVGVERTLAVLASAASTRKRGLIVKRMFDMLVAGPALAILTPIILITGAVLRLDHRSSVLFRQTRPGRHGKPFCLYKLRTMTDVFEKNGHPLPDAGRLRPLGRFVRRTSLDELPQLWNVLRGDMSLVGPRPLLMAYLDRYTPEQARRHEVKPGITGWAQVNGRNAISWEQKLDLDVWYVNNRTFALDLKILALTLVRVLRRQGISALGYETMPEFRGTLNSWNEPSTPGKK